MDTNEIRNQVQEIVTLAQTHEIDSFKAAQKILASIADVTDEASWDAMTSQNMSKLAAFNTLQSKWQALANQLYIVSPADHAERNWNGFDQKFSELANEYINALEGVN